MGEKNYLNLQITTTKFTILHFPSCNEQVCIDNFLLTLLVSKTETTMGRQKLQIVYTDSLLLLKCE